MGTKRAMLSNAVQQKQSLTSLDEHFPGRNFSLGVMDKTEMTCFCIGKSEEHVHEEEDTVK
jgi:hypothetical protein